MAQARWKSAFRAHVAPAHAGCVRANHLVGDMLWALRSPQLLQAHDAAGRYILLDFAVYNVEQAWMCLSASMAGMAAAELVALRGCGPVPTQPVASIANLHDVWLALARFQSATLYGQEALRRTEAAYGHLCAAQFMVSRLRPPAGPDAAMDEVHAVVGQVKGMLGIFVNMAWLVSLAAEPPAGGDPLG